MTAIHDTAYPRLKPNPDEQELKQNFLPIKAELELLNKSTSEKSPHSRLGFMLSLKCYQCLGYHIPINTIPKPIIEYIANNILDFGLIRGRRGKTAVSKKNNYMKKFDQLDEFIRLK